MVTYYLLPLGTYLIEILGKDVHDVQLVAERMGNRFSNGTEETAIEFSKPESLFGLYRMTGKIKDENFGLGGITKIGGTDSYGYLEDFSIKGFPKGLEEGVIYYLIPLGSHMVEVFGKGLNTVQEGLYAAEAAAERVNQRLIDD